MVYCLEGVAFVKLLAECRAVNNQQLCLPYLFSGTHDICIRAFELLGLQRAQVKA